MMALELERISQTRGSGRRAVHALRDVSLSVAAGEFVLLEGPSGAGKTTLLAVAAGLLTPTAGTVKLAGQSLGALSSAECRRHRAARVGFVFQRSNLLPQLTLWDNVLLMVAIGGVPRTEGEGEATQLLQALGIAGLAQRYPRELSGGEEQRAAVARALVHRPAIVLADEPTGNLDGVSGKAVAERLAGLAAERGTAVLVATHDPRLEPFATRRVRIIDGTIAA
ncbi:MAG TPA: ABC transporter ATP-binding protein [Gemmatimonadales bacterium]|jgi:putative ABC transport system ATP-binding protein|nr:ABC transporter ATP-binding protein [Gemmatimonadales bacterium]